VKNRKWLVSLPLVLALTIGISACGSSSDSGSSSDGGTSLSGQMAGAGASSQDAAMQAWIVKFQDTNPDVTISYDPVGSGGGREQFIAGGTIFGGTDSPFEPEEITAAQKQCGGTQNFVEVPVYISPIAVAYNVDGVSDLNLDPSTIAKIFAGDITNWNDPAIAKINPDATLPDLAISTVHRTDDSGTTANFTDYMSQTAPKDWTYPADDTWPIKSGEGADGTTGVVSAIKSGSGTIGYADLSQVGDLNVANVGVGGDYVPPSSEAAAKIVDSSKEVPNKDKNIVQFDLNRTTADSGIYPISLVSYEMACTQYDNAADAKNVAAFYKYIISPEGQSVAAEAAGSAPISDSLRKQITPAVNAIGAS